MRTTLQKIAWGAVGTLFLMAPVFGFALTEDRKAASTPTEYNWAYAEEASRLLREVRGLSVQLAHDADFLRLHSQQARLDSQSHAVHLNGIRNHVNAMGKHLMRLEDIRGEIAPWQQKALDRIVPEAVALADRAEAAISYHAEWRDNFWAPVYTNHVKALSEHAEAIEKSASLFLQYAENGERVEALERRIKSPDV